MAEAGWYDDPTGVAQLRYFDGRSWTEHVRSDEGPGSPHDAGTERQVLGDPETDDPRPRKRRRTALVVAGAALLLVTGAIGSYALFSDRGGQDAVAAADSEPRPAEPDATEVTELPAPEPSEGSDDLSETVDAADPEIVSEDGTEPDPEPEPEPEPNDPHEPATWDAHADEATIRRATTAIKNAFYDGSRAGFAAWAEATYPQHSAESLSQCMWGGEFAGFDVLDSERYQAEMRWSNLLPDADWELPGWGRPADAGYRVYLGDIYQLQSWFFDGQNEKDEFNSSGHVAVGADGEVIWFPACDDYLPG
jgi:hypothetical protein